MSRDWIAAYTTTLRKPKYRRLTISARAALLHVWLLAGGQDPEATWRDRAELEEVLELDGWTDPCEVVDELIQHRWLEVDADDRVLVHDWDEHQLAASKAAQVAYERDRKSEWRRRKRVEPAGPLSPAPLSPTEQDKTRHRSPNVPDTSGTNPGPRRDMSGTDDTPAVRVDPTVARIRAEQTAFARVGAGKDVAAMGVSRPGGST
jgi:hypothetical protein